LYIGCLKTSWSNNAFGLLWLQHVFEPYTRRKHGRDRRLLIVDGHLSHVNIAFIEFAITHKILLLVLPPYITHRLQPLNVGIFGPLAQAYSEIVLRLIQDSIGKIITLKALF
jgi:hypothetical protein